MDIEQTLLVSLISVVAGYFLSIWRNRLQPWITVLGFGESRKLSDKVIVNKTVIDASKESWYMTPLSQNEIEMDDLYRTVRSANNWLEINSSTENIINDGIKYLEQAQTQNEVIEALKPFLQNTGVSDLIELAVLRKSIVPEFHLDEKTYLTY